MSYGLMYYLLTVISGILNFIVFLNVSVLLLLVFMIINYYANTDIIKGEIQKEYEGYISKAIKTALILSLLISFIPTKKDMLIIAGLTVAESTIDEAVKIPPKLMKLINSEIDGLLEEKGE